MTKPTVGFAGMTHLGINSAAAAAARGFDIVCFDRDPALVDRLAEGDLPVMEPGLPELLRASAARLRYTADAAMLRHCDLLYVSADVPTDESGTSDLAGIRELISVCDAALRAEAILVVLCQVPPGFTRSFALYGRQIFYQVETLIFGQAVARAMHPERIIVGSKEPAAPLPAALRHFLESFECPILPMGFESAELAKISINCCLVASVSVANTLAGVCERIGANWAEIAPALKLDRRIGAHAYLQPGLGISGGNLERDLATVLELAGGTGADANVIAAFVRDGRYRKDWALRTLHRETLQSDTEPTVAILGVAYKEGTHSTKNSPSLALIRHLHPWRLRVHDPVVRDAPLDHPRLEVCRSALDAAIGAHVLVIMTPWPEYRDLDPQELADRMAGYKVIDPLAVLTRDRVLAAGLDYLTLGAPAARAKRKAA